MQTSYVNHRRSISVQGREACQVLVQDVVSQMAKVKGGRGIMIDSLCRKHDRTRLCRCNQPTESDDYETLTLIVDVNVAVHLILFTPMQI